MHLPKPEINIPNNVTRKITKSESNAKHFDFNRSACLNMLVDAVNYLQSNYVPVGRLLIGDIKYSHIERNLKNKPLFHSQSRKTYYYQHYDIKFKKYLPQHSIFFLFSNIPNHNLSLPVEGPTDAMEVHIHEPPSLGRGICSLRLRDLLHVLHQRPAHLHGQESQHVA